jgi:EmrB/QacA subfamily drug resistance transporter
MEAQADSRRVRRPGPILAVLAVGGSSYAILQSLVLPALPVLQREFDTSQTGVTWIFTTYLVSASVATPIAGRLGDMFGKKRVLLVVLAALGIGSLVAALAASLPVMIVARTIQGVGGAFFPLAFGIVRDEFPRERVPGGIGLISGLVGIGSGVGIVLAGPILAHLGYHWLFWIPFAVIVPTTILTLLVIPESPVRAPGNVDVVGAVLLSSWLVALLIGISEGHSWGWASGRILGLFAAALVLCVVWIRVESRTREPLVDMAMMRLRGVWTTNLSGFLVGLGMFGSFVLIPQFVSTSPSAGYGFGASVTQAGLYLLPTSIMMIVAAPVAGKLAARFGAKLPLVAGVASATVVYLLLAFAHDSSWQIYLAATFLGIGIGFAFASMANLIVEAVGPEQTGVATGMNAVMRTVGGALGGQAAASILAASVVASGLPSEAGYTLSFGLMAGALALALAASLAVPGRARERAHVVAVAGPQVSVE